MKRVTVTQERIREDKYGGGVVTVDYTVTDEIGNKKAGSGNFAISDAKDTEVIATQTRVMLEAKLGYKGFIIDAAKRGPGRPPKVA